MTTLLVATRQHVEANNRRLAETRHLIRLSRRILNHPMLNISGASDANDHLALDGVVRALLTAGTLKPLRSEVAWAGNGSGKACCVCGKPVEGSDIEYEADDGGARVAGCHLACFVVWQQVSRTFSPYQAAGETQPRR